MTPTEIIEIVDRVTPNAHTTEDKLRWLAALEAQIRLELRELNALPEPQDEAAGPAVPEPFAEEVYVSFLQACMAWADEDDARYDRFITRFNDAYNRFMGSVLRGAERLPKRRLRF